MKDATLINVILDRSGSMQSIARETVGAFNNFLKEQKELPDYAELSLFQFDNLYEQNYIRKPIKKCKDLISGSTYSPRGMTALYDAVGRTITTVGDDLKNMSEEERPKRILFVIISDGCENASKEFNNVSVNGMIDHQKEKYNWDFIFLGAGIDAVNEGSKFGITLDKCGSFDHSANGIGSVGKTMSSYTSTYRITGDTDAKVDDHKSGGK